MGKFMLDIKEGFGEEVEVEYPKDITKTMLQDFVPFRDWKQALRENLDFQRTDENHVHHNDPYTLRSITIESVTRFGKRIGFLKLSAEIRNIKQEEPLPGTIFLRGGAVAVLMILRPEESTEERYVIMTEQPRVPAGSLRFLEIPAGMLDGDKNFVGKAAVEIEEETGMKIRGEELIDMTHLALKDSEVQDTVRNAMYPSPGGSDEFIHIYLWEKVLRRQRIEEFRDKLTGQRTQGEMITLRVTKYETLWREGARDAKTLAAWALYEGLSRARILPKEPMKPDTSDGDSPDDKTS